jgi:glutamyl-tRNA reductase
VKQLRERLHFGWIGATIAAMTFAYVATGSPNVVVVSNAAIAVPTRPAPPVIIVPDRPTSLATPNIVRPVIPTIDVPSLDDIEEVIEDAEEAAEEAEEQAEEAREDAEEQAEESEEDAEQEASDAERDAGREAERARADAERQRAAAERHDDLHDD